MTKTNHLDAWLAQEQIIRAVMDAGAGPGVARPEQLAGKTGLQLMQSMLRGEIPLYGCLPDSKQNLCVFR